MRVLWLGHNLSYPPVRGVLQRNYNLLREATKSCEVHVLAFDQPATRPPGVTAEDCVRALREFCTGVEWVPLSKQLNGTDRYVLALRGLTSHDPIDLLWLQSREMAGRLRKKIEASTFDVIHFDTLGLAQYRSVVKDAKTVLNHHNLESAMMDRRAMNEPNALRRRFWYVQSMRLRQAEKRWCPQFDMNVLVSGEDEELFLKEIPGVKTTVVANGVDTNYFLPRSDPGGKVLLFCGGLDWYPNSDAMRFFFVCIWPRLTARMADLKMYVVGRNPPKWLRQLSAKDGRIQVSGFVDDVRPYFQKATAYVCPIRCGGGTRLKILDALAMGLPLIATRFACSGLSTMNEKHLLIAETPEDFANQTERALTDRNLRLTIAEEGRKLVCQEYSWTSVGRQLTKAYESASAASGRRM